MYNQDNREKVKRDELKHEEEERLRKAKHDAAESEHRRQILLQRARGGHQLAAAQVLSSGACAFDTHCESLRVSSTQYRAVDAPVGRRGGSLCTV